MDWTLKAAKKKTNAIPGGSRSIIESLNALNNICDEGQEAINQILKGFDVVPYSAVSRSLANTNNTSMSPENTTNITRSTEDRHTAVLNTPKVEKNDLVPNVTPRSISESKEEVDVNLASHLNNEVAEVIPVKSPLENVLSNTSTNNTTNVVSNKNEAGRKKDRESGWSPFKADRSMQNISMQSTDNRVFHETSTTYARNSEEKITAEKKLQFSDSHADHKPLSYPLRSTKPLSESERAFRKKSNMFIPLPSKETFVMKSSPGENERKEMELATTQQKDELEKDLIKDSAKAPRAISEEITEKRKESLVEPQTIPRKINNNTHSSVFERLSSIPTKSFQKKISKQALEKNNPSSVTNRRLSIHNNRSDRKSIVKSTLDTSMQDTLRDIFVSSNNSNPTKKDSTPLKKDVDDGKLPKFRKSLLPTMRRSSLASSISAIKISNDQAGKKSELDIGLKKSIPAIKEDTHTRITPLKPISSSIISPTKSSLLKSVQKGSPKRIEKSPGIHSIKSKIQTKHDRLTNFQLMPTLESKKTELKKKLNKRLSEVMRTQFEQQRKKTKQKRKSHINEEIRKQKKTVNETKENSFSVSEVLSDGSNFIRYHEKGHRHFETTNENRRILDTIDTVDHRVFIGENHVKNEKLDGDCSLPEISSDSEAEETQVLATWAEPANLEKCMLEQRYMDPVEIFGPVYPLKPEEIFRSSRVSNIKSKN
ncbi:hypothetical protein RNJ44_03944 [Nakaseomyces bracarensis]|uniref:Inner centromere protein ARK-binding domain-containing protein n=1 Tax=Nakaseomyces bracarensis TaxID=273131 RepID=A0ABR4NYK8_9SACH